MSRIAADHWQKEQADRADAPEPAGEPGERGRRATAPTDIPAKGWKDVAWRIYKEVSDDRVMLVSAGVTFYLLLALAPLLAALVSIYGLFLDPAEIPGQTATLANILPGGAIDIIDGQLKRLAEAGGSSLGLTFVISLSIALWSANSGMKTLFDAMNIAYDEVEKRGFVKLTLVTLAFTVSLIAGIIALMAFNTVFTYFEGAIGIAIPDPVVDLITAGLALAGFIVFMALLYRIGPSRESPKWRWITPGAIFAAVGAIIVSVLFSFYVANFGTYNETYGSLGAIVGFLTWLWLVMVVLVMGGELNSELEHQTAKDTTTGPSEPMGERGAVMADRVGRRYGQD